MYRLSFEKVTIDIIQNGYRNLWLNPYIGPYEVEHNKEIKIKFKYKQSIPPHYREEQEIIGLYILNYGRILKLGTATLSSIVSRMYSQAPLYGVVYALFICKRKIKISNDLDRQVYVKLNNLFYKHYKIKFAIRKPNIKHILQSWLKYSINIQNTSISNFKEYLEFINSVIDKIKDFERISPISLYWFTPYFNGELIKMIRTLYLKIKTRRSMSINSLRNQCRNKLCRGKLMVFYNGLCKLELYDQSIQLITTCDQISHNLILDLDE